MVKWFYLHKMKSSKPTQSVRIDKEVVKDVKIFVANNGGSIKAVLQNGALAVMSKGAKSYLKYLRELEK